MRGFRNQTKCLPAEVTTGVVNVGCFAPERGVRMTHFPQGYPGMYYCEKKEVCSSVVGEIVYVKEDFVDSTQEKLDFLEEYYGPNDSRNMYRRETVSVLNEATGVIVSCDTYFCLLDPSGGVDVPPKDGKLSWRKYMESSGLEGAGEDWAQK